MALHWYVLMVVSYSLALVCLDGGEALHWYVLMMVSYGLALVCLDGGEL